MSTLKSLTATKIEKLSRILYTVTLLSSFILYSKIHLKWQATDLVSLEKRRNIEDDLVTVTDVLSRESVTCVITSVWRREPCLDMDGFCLVGRGPEKESSVRISGASLH